MQHCLVKCLKWNYKNLRFYGGEIDSASYDAGTVCDAATNQFGVDDAQKNGFLLTLSLVADLVALSAARFVAGMEVFVPEQVDSTDVLVAEPIAVANSV